ncbi:hypothetical protein [Methylobacterium sp. WCS2018Hpa-22]|jgi:uncharacterized protein YcsI (UPF0317 family)|uniref:hypothetical protein n=1 Tax=Methylobacterium sp. WCS2018Hpa-22 TaxID=3073633 RepID=UPI002889395F|nr:hypothetical protein [Methylobacterium sp. WCS2018Hpa-22]
MTTLKEAMMPPSIAVRHIIERGGPDVLLDSMLGTAIGAAEALTIGIRPDPRADAAAAARIAMRIAISDGKGIIVPPPMAGTLSRMPSAVLRLDLTATPLHAVRAYLPGTGKSFPRQY